MIFYSTLIANQCIVDTVVHLERPFAFLVKKKKLNFSQTSIHLISLVLILGQILGNLGQL